MQKLILLLCLALCCAAIDAAAPTPSVFIHHGFYTGNLYRNLPEVDRRLYVDGVIDGLMMSPLLGVQKSNLAWLESCVTGMQDDQAEAIINQYLVAHPEKWDSDMEILVFLAIQDACAARGFPRR